MFNLSADRAIHSFSANMENEEGCFEVVYGVVADAGVVHHWDGSLDGVASLWLSKERVPADGTREIWEMAQNHS